MSRLNRKTRLLCLLALGQLVVGPLVLVPASAIALYAALIPLDTGVRGEGPFFLILLAFVIVTTLVGAVALTWSLWRTWKPRRTSS